jgi:hypothetical protein
MKDEGQKKDKELVIIKKSLKMTQIQEIEV